MTDTRKGATVAFRCPDKIVERLDRIAKKGEIPRSKLILNMVEIMLDYAEFTQKVGILQLGMLFRDANENLKKVAKKWRERKSIDDLTN